MQFRLNVEWALLLFALLLVHGLDGVRRLAHGHFIDQFGKRGRTP
jgi:hypothetical protein